MTKRAVLYARVSYDDRDTDGRNLAGQLEIGREYSASKGYQVVAELAEDERGVSGKDWDLPQLNRALEMARAGEFDVLVVRELDRLARGLAKQLVIEGELNRAGVEVEYVLGEYDNTPEGALMKNVRAVIAEYERLKITERMARGRRQKVKEGNVLVSGRPPYGYQVAERDGKTTLEVHEPEAQIVRQIFTWYTEGDGEEGPMTLSGIAERLFEMQVPTFADTGLRKGGRVKQKAYGEWGRITVKRILSNELYVGVWRYGKRNGRQRKINPESHTISVEVPAIVSCEVWKAAQERLAHNRGSVRGKPKYEYLLSRRVTCGCGLKMRGSSTISRKGKVYLYYVCPAVGSRDYSRTRNSLRFPVSQVDAMVWTWLKEMLADPERLAQGRESSRTEQEKATEPIRARLAVVESLIADNRKQLDKLIDLYLSGEFPKEMLVERKARLQTTINSLERERVTRLAHLEAQTFSDEQIQTIRKFAARIGKGLENAHFEARRAMIEALDIKAMLTVVDGEKVMEVECVLPGERALLSIGTHHKKPYYGETKF